MVDPPVSGTTVRALGGTESKSKLALVCRAASNKVHGSVTLLQSELTNNESECTILYEMSQKQSTVPRPCVLPMHRSTYLENEHVPSGSKLFGVEHQIWTAPK